MAFLLSLKDVAILRKKENKRPFITSTAHLSSTSSNKREKREHLSDLSPHSETSGILCKEKIMWLEKISEQCRLYNMEGLLKTSHILNFLQYQLSLFIKQNRDPQTDPPLFVARLLNETELAYICYISKICSPLYEKYIDGQILTSMSWLAALHYLLVSMLYSDSLRMMMLPTGFYAQISYVERRAFTKMVIALAWKFGDKFIQYQEPCKTLHFMNGVKPTANNDTFF